MKYFLLCEMLNERKNRFFLFGSIFFISPLFQVLPFVFMLSMTMMLYDEKVILFAFDFNDVKLGTRGWIFGQ